MGSEGAEDAAPRMHRVVIVGGGFAGMRAVRALRRAPVEVTLIDRRNFHLFQPLLYQVATGGLSPGEIAMPLRAIVRRQRNTQVVMGEVASLDVDAQLVRLASGRELGYDSLIVATGATHAYFGHDEWRTFAPGLKSIEDALELRARILNAFEQAELEDDPHRIAAWLTFVVVGAGPTGVEMAGQIAEMARDTLRHDFRRIDPTQARVVVLDAVERALGTFPEPLSRRAMRDLEALGVNVRTGHTVTGVEARGVRVTHHAGEDWIEARTVVWAAGVAASPVARELAAATGSAVDRAGRLPVLPDLTLPGHPEIFVCGDMITLIDPATGHPLPGVAPVAMQQGRHAGRTVAAAAAGRPPPGPFRYRDKGALATIGRRRAVADIRGLRLTGTIAWLVWIFVHLVYLIGFQNRLLVLTRWAFSYVTRNRGARLITEPRSRQ
ncbi:MAG: NAD(P)/FAD-dependent oxidoreductase [Gaiellales bacterium]